MSDIASILLPLGIILGAYGIVFYRMWDEQHQFRKEHNKNKKKKFWI